MILFVSIVAPLIMMLFVLKGHSRTVMIFLISGIVVAVLSSTVENYIKKYVSIDGLFFTVNVSPVIEEILKALLIFILALYKKPKIQHLLECAVSVGVGFAIIENAYIFAKVSWEANIYWAFIRGFGTGLMHALCTLLVGLGMSYVYNKRKLFITGILGLLILSVIIHSIYNNIIQSAYQGYGIYLPLILYVPVIASMWAFNKKKGKEC